MQLHIAVRCCARPGMTSYKGLPRCITSPPSSPAWPSLFYFFTSFRVGKARGHLRHQGAGDLGQSRLRADVSRPDEHAGVDADFPAVAVAVCDLHQRPIAAALGARLDRRPHPLHDRLFASRGKARPGLLDPGTGRRHSLAGRARRRSSGAWFTDEWLPVIASAAKQSIPSVAASGLLRYARNDEQDQK